MPIDLLHYDLPKGQFYAAYRGFMPGAMGASGAVNSLVIFSVLLQPTATVLIYGILPLPAFVFGGMWLFYDLRGAITQVFLLPVAFPA